MCDLMYLDVRCQRKHDGFAGGYIASRPAEIRQESDCLALTSRNFEEPSVCLFQKSTVLRPVVRRVKFILYHSVVADSDRQVRLSRRPQDLEERKGDFDHFLPDASGTLSRLRV